MHKSAILIAALCLPLGQAQAQTPQQTVQLLYGTGSVAASSQSASLLYSATGNARTTGLGIRVHFNSAQVQIAAIENLLPEASLGLQILPDADDLDQDPATDQYIMAAWADLLGAWPATPTGQVELFTIAYDTLPGMEQTAFTVTDSAVAVGFEFVARQGD